MSTIKDGGQAFPIPFGQVMSTDSKGMSLRDYFAGQATAEDIQYYMHLEQRTFSPAQARWRFADDMLAAREVQP